MRTKLVRVRPRRRSARGRAALFALALTLYILLNIERGDPVRAVLEARDAERIRAELTLEALELHAVRTAVCDSAETARLEAARYVRRGAAGYVFEREVRHVLCAGYETQAEAQAVSERLNREDGIASDVLSLLASAVTVRATATRLQLDALTACEGRLRETERLIGALSAAIDREKTPPEQALDVLNGQRRALEEAAEALRLAAGGEGDAAVCAPLLRLADAAAGDIAALCAQKSLTKAALSSRLRYIFLKTRAEHILYLAGLGG